MANQNWFVAQETAIQDSQTKNSLSNTFDGLEQRIQDGFDDVDDAIAAVATPPWADKVVHIDPETGNDTTADGSVSHPYKTINAAVAAVEVCPSTPEGAYQWVAEKLILKLAPGMYTEGGTEYQPTDVQVNLKRCHIMFDGSGSRIIGGVKWTFDTVDLPYGDAFMPASKGIHHVYMASPWNIYLQSPSPVLDFNGSGGGMEAGATTENLIIFGRITQHFTQNTVLWQLRLGSTYTVFNHVNCRYGFQITSDNTRGLSACVMEINDSTFVTPNSSRAAGTSLINGGCWITGNGTTATATQWGHGFFTGQQVTLTGQTSQSCSISGNGTLATVTQAAHKYVDGERITISGTTNYDGTYAVTVTGVNTYTFATTGIAVEAGTAIPVTSFAGTYTITVTNKDYFTFDHASTGDLEPYLVVPTLPNIGGMSGDIQLGIKAHNSRIDPVIGPIATIYEIDNCRVQNGFDRTYGGVTGNVSFLSSTSYSGFRDCAVPTATFKLGTGTSAVTMVCDEITAKQVLASTIDTGTGTFTMSVMDIHFGTTANRPAYNKVGVGYRYFDTTLNKPVWRGNAGWVDATGTAV